MSPQRVKVTILGSGTSMGVPMPCCDCAVCHSADAHDRRLRASVLVEADGRNLLIDCGPDFRQQMLRHDVRHLDAVLITHVHYDHASGLDDLRPYAYGEPLPFYAEATVCDTLRQKYDYIFIHRYPGVPRLMLHEVRPDVPLAIGGVEVLPIRLMHGRLPILGYRIGPLAYLTDCTAIPDTQWPLLEGVRTLIIDALRFKPHPTHFCVREAVAVVERLRPRQTFFTHMSHDIGFHAEVERRLPDGVHLAYDNLIIDA